MGTASDVRARDYRGLGHGVGTCSAEMAICTTSSKLNSVAVPLYFFSSQLTASWSLAPAPVACARV